MRTLGRVKNTLVILFFSVLATACSVVPKKQAQLTGITELAVWKEGLPEAKAANAAKAKYDQARSRVNQLISPRLELEIDRVARQSIFGLGGSVDLSKEKIIDAETVAAVKEFYDSKRAFGSGGVAAAAGVAALKWAEEAAREARQASATDLKRQLNTYKWPAWSEVK